MSARAAARFAELGFDPIYDYVDGKQDWMASGWPRVGPPSIGDLARRGVPTCKSDERLLEVVKQVERSGFGQAIVLSEHEVLVGRLQDQTLVLPSDVSVAEAMERGPKTYRPNIPVKEMLNQMDERGFNRALVTTLEGKFVGVFCKEDA